MPMQKLTLKPGVNVERTPTLNEGGISTSQLIRFFDGLPQKIGGWTELIPEQFVGTCRGMHGWGDLNGNPYLALGTEQKLYVVNGGQLQDITPIRTTTNNPVSISTTSGSSTVTVNDPGNGALASDWLTFNTHVSVGGIVLFGQYQISGAAGSSYPITVPVAPTATVSDGGAVASLATTSGSGTVTVTLANHGLVAGDVWNQVVAVTVGGITLSGLYSVQTVPSSSTFTITAADVATSTASASENGGDMQIAYDISTGYAVNTPQAGWGMGAYGAGEYGIGSSGQQTAPMRQWSLQHFGQDLIASPTEGGIYYWSPQTEGVAQELSATAPTSCRVVRTVAQAEIVAAFGSEASGALQPTLVSWCDAGDFTDWTPTATNQAGNYQIPSGSKIVAASGLGLGVLIWTDVDLWSMTYQGLPYVFGFNRVAVACEALSMRCIAPLSGYLVIWLNQRTFFQYNGFMVQPMKCPVWDFMWDQIDLTQLEATFCAVNTVFNEAAWYFPLDPSLLGGDPIGEFEIGVSAIGGTLPPMGYVKYNYLENLWDCGYLDRTAWVDVTPMGNPIGASSNGQLYQHENGTDAAGLPINWSWSTGYIDLAQGEEYPFLDMVIPDFLGDYTSIQMEITALREPNAAPLSHGPYNLTPSTPYVNTRVRGRQVAFKFSGNDLRSFNRLGAIRYRVAAAGRR